MAPDEGVVQGRVQPRAAACSSTLNRITAERVALYHRVQPPGENIPISVNTFLVEDLVPMKDKI